MAEHMERADTVTIPPTRVVDLHKKFTPDQVGWLAGAGHVNVGRGNIIRIADADGAKRPFPPTASPLANPFKISAELSRDRAVAKFEYLLLTSPDLMAQAVAMRGCILGCWCVGPGCHPAGPRETWVCHAQVIAHYADGGSKPP